MPRPIRDLTGQRFGMLTAVQPTEKRQGGAVIWECQCDCGKTAFVLANHLRDGRTRSCGCLKKGNITGQRFGKLVAIRRTDERREGSIVWECLCDCGKTAFVPVARLQAGRTRSCGCLKKADIAGQRFGKLVAIRRTDERRGGSIVWECLCDCGKTAFVPVARLREGGAKSCGCLKGVDITGQRFGKLVAIRRTDERREGSIVWECLCDCGKTAFVPVKCLHPDGTKSCGCLRGTRGNRRSAISGDLEH